MNSTLVAALSVLGVGLIQYVLLLTMITRLVRSGDYSVYTVITGLLAGIVIPPFYIASGIFLASRVWAG